MVVVVTTTMTMLMTQSFLDCLSLAIDFNLLFYYIFISMLVTLFFVFYL